MYVYFDNNGVLKEIITERPFRAGDSQRDKIYIYWEGEHTPTAGWVKYRKADGTFTTETSITLTQVNKTLPTDPLQNLKYFSYEHTYTDGGVVKVGYPFYELTVPSAVLTSAVNGDLIPTSNNMCAANVRFVFSDSSIDNLGVIVFSVETSIGILTDNSIDETQYNYLIIEISRKFGLDNLRSVKVDELPETGETGTIYYVKIEDEEVYNVYYWNALTTAFVFLGTTSCGLYTQEEGAAFESEVNDKLDEMTETIEGLGNLEPSGTDTSTNILAFTEDKGIYIGTDTGHWYYWNGTQYVDGGVYQATEIADNTITRNKLSNDIDNAIFSDDYNYEDIIDSADLTSGFLNKYSGAVNNESGSRYCDYIDTSSYDKIYVSGSSQYDTCLIAAYDENKVFKRAYGSGTSTRQTFTNYEYTPLSDEKYIRCSTYGYVSYPLLVKIREYIPRVKIVEDDVSTIKDEINIDEYYIKDITSDYTLVNKYIDKTSGNLSNDTNARCIEDYFPLQETDLFKITGASQYQTCLIATYDENKTFLRVYGAGTNTIQTFDDYEFTPQSDEKYARFGTFPYYNTSLIVKKRFKYVVNTKIEELDDEISKNRTVLYGKKYVACGDSFTYGDATPLDKVYPYLIAQRNKMNLVNMARNGAFAHYDSDYLSFLSSTSPTYYQNIPSDADYITIAFGLNEINNPLGNKTSSDNTTIWGAYNEALSWLIQNRPNAKIGIISNDAWMTETFRNTLRDIAQYWCVGFLDLKADDSPLLIGGKYIDVSSVVVSTRNSMYKISSSNSHPNELGQSVRSYIIENWLKTL